MKQRISAYAAWIAKSQNIALIQFLELSIINISLKTYRHTQVNTHVTQHMINNTFKIIYVYQFIHNYITIIYPKILYKADK